MCVRHRVSLWEEAHRRYDGLDYGLTVSAEHLRSPACDCGFCVRHPVSALEAGHLEAVHASDKRARVGTRAAGWAAFQ